MNIANDIIKHNSQRSEKTLWSDKKATDRVRVLTCISGYQEGNAIAQIIKAISSKKKLQTIAILYRAHYQSRIIEETLLKHSIAYKIIGGIQFYERKEIKDILAYLKLIANPHDRVSFFRIINSPTRGLGQKFEEQCHQLWAQEPLYDFITLLKKCISTFSITGKKALAITSFIKIFEKLSPDKTALECAESVIALTGYFNYLLAQYEPEEADTKRENIKELVRALSHFHDKGIETVTDFLAEVALMQEHLHNRDQSNDYVQLMTLHAAKGLEFDMVVLTGLEEGIFPSNRSLADNQMIEEERRLFYVGITRAKEHLLLTNSRYRYTFGTMSEQRTSRFLTEIPVEHCNFYDSTQWTEQQFRRFGSDWFHLKPENNHVITFGAASRDIQPQALTLNFKKTQPVKHKSFGIGIIQKIETKGSAIYITVRFKVGVKKIKSNFLQPI